LTVCLPKRLAAGLVTSPLPRGRACQRRSAASAPPRHTRPLRRVHTYTYTHTYTSQVTPSPTSRTHTSHSANRSIHSVASEGCWRGGHGISVAFLVCRGGAGGGLWQGRRGCGRAWRLPRGLASRGGWRVGVRCYVRCRLSRLDSLVSARRERPETIERESRKTRFFSVI
jgi:hypothetical protein